MTRIKVIGIAFNKRCEKCGLTSCDIVVDYDSLQVFYRCNMCGEIINKKREEIKEQIKKLSEGEEY